MEIDNKAIGQRIREEREKLGLSREEFAEFIGLSDYYVGQLERGERQMSLPVLVKIANCLHATLDYLIFGKTTYDGYYVHNALMVYDAGGSKGAELNSLLSKCTPRELDMITKLIKTILPYVRRS